MICIRIEEKASWQAIDGSWVNEKDIIEVLASIDKSGFITMFKNCSSLNDFECKKGECNNIVSSEKCYYTSNGVMIDREYKQYGTGPLSVDISRANVDSALLIARNAFNYGFWHDKFISRTLLTRRKIDTARLVIEDKQKNIFYTGIVTLNGEHGYRDMAMLGGNFDYPIDYIINPLPIEEINRILEMENNPKVRDALRELAKGREDFYYDSTKDPSFHCDGVIGEGYGRK